ncbi:MAG: formamidopyrimidine-DNA glycosylase [Gemmatimonadetes bacterium]|jgi:formamidopyrimidine-DNA glycosylase|nr:formamidopyrimidine-DNA glycosylase [Gemmatimonadota bacterium]
MPELPEVEAAMETLRRRAKGRTIARVELLHPALRRRVSPAQLRALAGARIDRVERRGKHQLLHLDDGRILHVHFRMNGDWAHGRQGTELPRFARAVVDFDDDTRLILVDSRMLGTLDVHPAGVDLALGLGPDAADAGWTAEQFGRALAPKRGPIKPVLLDQRVVAGLGNIYAAESLWRARINPFTAANALVPAQVATLRRAIATVIRRATGSRYTDEDAASLDVYDREGLPCRRCGTAIERVMQAQRSTFFCPSCQPHGGVAAAKKAVKKVAKKAAKKAAKAVRKQIPKAVAKKVATKRR